MWRARGRFRWPALAVGALVLLGCTSPQRLDELAVREWHDAGGGRPAAAPTTWLSGAFLAPSIDLESAAAMGEWRGSPLDVIQVYPDYGTWRQMVDYPGPLEELAGFDGVLLYGLPLLPDDGSGSLAEVAEGRHDAVFASIADALGRTGHEDAVVRVGLEANGDWFPWGATAESASTFRAAARRVMALMSERTPELRMAFDITCGRPLDGSDDRMAALTELYPGDDLTDVIGCDHYDTYYVAATSEEGWSQALRPTAAPGLSDVADFARSRGKQFAVPEWGLSHQSQGAGDNPAFIGLMRQFFEANADVLAIEAYFDEPDGYIDSALWGNAEGSINPQSAAEYRRLW